MKIERCENGHIYNKGRYKECPYCNTERLEEAEEKEFYVTDFVEHEDDKTDVYWANEIGIDPVVGWIVCIDGHHKGQDFKLKAEKNYIGRAPEMDICLEGDSAISRKNHAILAYNPKERIFMMIPGEGNGIVYVQNNAVFAPQKLENRHMIEMGTSKFIFIELCGKNFDWKNETPKIKILEENLGRTE